MCMCLARGGVDGEGGEWMRGLGLGLTTSCGNRGSVGRVSVFLLRLSGVGSVGGEWVGGLTRVWRVGWCYVCVSCESGLSV